MSCDLKDILIFCSGTDHIPPTGFAKSPAIEFAYQQNLPTASTCDIVLRLPCKHADYPSFREFMILGIKGNLGFVGV